MKFSRLAAAFAALSIVAAATAGMAQVGAGAHPPTPPPVLIESGTPVPVAIPTGTATPAPRRARATPAAPAPTGSGSETPAPPQFSTLDGVWEMQIQYYDARPAVYEHLFMTQNADAVNGTWVRDSQGKKKLPFTGTFDGRQFRFVAKDGAQTLTLTGYVDNFSDIVGLIDYGANLPSIAFTAAHRKKDRSIL